MDAITNEAVTSLNSFIESLIPTPTLPNQSFELLLTPTRVSSAGIGGFIGMQDVPYGEIRGRRIVATAEIAITSRQNHINESVSTLTGAILSLDRSTLRTNGVYRFDLDALGDAVLSGQGGNINATRIAKFDLLYEFVKGPDSAGDLINDVNVDMDLAESDGQIRFIVNSEFTQALFDRFTVVDDPQATTAAPSNWSFDNGDGRVEQTKRIRGGGLTTANAKKAGTYLLQPVDSDFPEVKNFILESEMEYDSDDGTGDGIGFIFRYQDVDNFYFFIMSERHGYRMFGKKVAGAFDFLTTGGLDNGNGYVGQTHYQMKLVATNSRFNIYMDEQLVLTAQDDSIASAGRVGLMCHGNGAANFYSIKVLGYL